MGFAVTSDGSVLHKGKTEREGVKESQSQMEDVGEKRCMKVRNKRSRQLNAGVDNTTRVAFKALF